MALACLAVATVPAYAVDNLPDQFVVETVLNDLTDPVNLVKLPDGRMFVLEKGGKVKLFDPAQQPATTKIILGIGAIQNAAERGLASIALDPDFQNNGHFYLYYTQLGNGNRNRLSRFTFDFAAEFAGSEVLVWEDNEPVDDCCHFGGGLDFGPDNMLYLATGEEFDGPQAQDLTRAGGKLIRLNTANLDASGAWVRGGANTHIIPADNPAEIMDGPGPNLDEIWAYGLRNPYRMHWDLVENRLYIGEVGGNIQATATEDLHIGRKGANYGWPVCEGDCVDPTYDDPIYFYGHTGESPAGGAITAGVTYRGGLFPAEYEGAFFITDYSLGYVKYIKFDANGDFESINDFADNAGPIVALELGDDEALYGVDFVFGKVIRFVYDSGNQRPEITVAEASVNSGPPPLPVQFTASATDAEGDALTYHWYFGDGTDQVGQNVSKTYTETGLYNAFLVVSDADGTRTSDLIPIQVGTPPIASISLPLDNSLFRAGVTLDFSGSNVGPTDSGPYTFEWDVKFVHNAHIHPSLIAAGASGQFEIADHGHDYHDETGYRFTLKITDADGLSDTAESTIFPDKVNLLLNTLPVNLPITVDGLPIATPIIYDTVIDFQHVLSVPASLCSAGTNYEFDSWSNGSPRTHGLQVPPGGLALTANFTDAGPCDFIPAAGLVMHLESDQGVETTGDLNAAGGDPITAWRDLSGNNNDLIEVSGDPVIFPGGFNGKPVVDFDGFGDALLRINGHQGMPLGSSDRTIFLLASYEGPGAGGFGYGLRARNSVFGLHISDEGLLRINGFSGGFDFVSNTAGTGAGWLIQSAKVEDDFLTHYKNDQLIDIQQNTYGTQYGPIVLGSDLDQDPYLDMQVAAVIVYDRALSDAERAEVLNYLDQKYFTVDGNRVPTAIADNAGVANGGTVTIDVASNDLDDGTIDPTTVTIVQMPGSGVATVDPATGLIQYTHNSVSISDSFTYTVADDAGIVSNAARVNIELDAPGDLISTGLVARFESDMGVLETGGLVTGWTDTSGTGNDLATVGNVALVENALGEMPAIVFDGDDDRMQRIGNLIGVPSQNQDRSVYMLVKYNSPGYGGFTWGEALPNQAFGIGLDPSETGKLMVQGWGLGNDFFAIQDGVDEGWIVQSAVLEGGLLRHFENGVLIDIRSHDYNTSANRMTLAAELDGDPQVAMEVGAVLVYDRALTVLEQQTVQNYLQVKFDVRGTNNEPPITKQDRITVASGDTGEIDVLENDYDEGGSLDITSVAIVDQPTGGSVTVDPLFGRITYTHGGVTLLDEFTYTVEDDIGQVSEPTLVKVKIGTPVELPIEHIVSRYESDIGVDLVGGNRVVRWKDQIFRFNNHFTGRGDTNYGAPLLVEDALNGFPIIRFDGVDDALARFGIMAGYPNKFTDRSIYMVVSYKGAGGGFTYGQLRQNRRFGLVVDATTGNLGVVAGGSGNDSISSVNAVNSGWSVHGADVVDDVLYHRFNNELIGTFAHEFNTEFEGQAVMGADFDFSPFVKMDVAALFVYDDPLTDQERADLHAYIEDKYEISAAVIPQAVDDTFEIVTETVNNLAVLANDTDDLGLVPGSVAVVSQPTGGTAVVNSATGSITYTHGGVTETDEFTYTVADANGNVSSSALVSIIVDTDLSPVAFNDNAGVLYESSVVIDVLENDSDDFGIDLTSVSIVQTPGSGTAAVDPVNGTISYTHNGLGSSDFFTYVVLDSTGQVSNVARVDIELLSPGQLPTTGLVAQFETDSGVVVSGGSVQSWSDLSGNGNDLLGVGDPELALSVLGGLPAITLDGGQDRLQRIGNLVGFPNGNADRTVFFLARYRDTGVGGASFGSAANNENFGLVVNRFGRLGVSGYGAGNDFYTAVDGDDAGWIVQSATLSGGVLTQFLDGAQISAELHDYATNSTRLVLGAEIGGSPQLDMDLGAYIVYDRVLSTNERQQVQNYLQIKYAIDFSNNEAPVAVDDRQRLPSASVSPIAILDNDIDDTGFDFGSLELVAAPAFGTVEFDSATGEAIYSHDGFSSSDSFTYRVRDVLGRISNIATVSVTIGEPIELPLLGLSARWESTDLVTQIDGVVSDWGDLSGFDNTLTALGDISIAQEALNGLPVFNLDGANDAFFRDDVLHDFVNFNADRTVIMLTKYDGLGDGGFGFGELRRNRQFAIQVGEQGQLRVSGRSPENDFETSYIATGNGWIAQSATLSGGVLTQSVNAEPINVANHTFNTQNDRLAIGSDLSLDNFVDMDLAAVLVYRRALSPTELQQAIDYLDFKYGYRDFGAPEVVADTATVGVGGTVSIDVLGNDTAIEGAIDPATLQIVAGTAFGTLSSDPVTGAVTYIHDAGPDTADSFTYRVANLQGRFSVEARVDIEIDSDLSPIATDDTDIFESGETIQIGVLLNDTDDFGLDPSTVTIVESALGGALSVDPTTGVVSYTHGGTVLSDNFTYTVADLTGQVSNIATVSLGIPDGLPGSGLVLLLESDFGVEEVNGTVTQWLDQSINSNDLTSTGDPQLVTDDLTIPVVHLDGDGDRLERLSNINGMPLGDGDRSVFVLVSYEGVGFGGFAYGDSNTNEAFGLVVNQFGRLGVQGWGSGNDFITSENGTGQGWFLQSAVVESNLLTHAINGTPLSNDTHAFATSNGRIMLGANLNGGPQVDMKVGAILVYDRAVSPVEQAQIFNYVDSKYGLSTFGDPSPIAANDFLTIPNGAAAEIAVLNNDIDFDAEGNSAALDASTVVLIDQPQFGTAQVNPLSGVVTYIDSGAQATDEFSYAVRDLSGQLSNTAVVKISNLPTSGLVAHYEADAQVTVGAAGDVISVGDRSGQGNDLFGFGDVNVVEDGLNGNAIFDFDGVDDVLKRTDGLQSMPLGASPRTIIQLVKYDSAGSGGFGYGQRSSNKAFGLHVQAPDGLLRINGFGPSSDKVSNTVGTGAGWIVQSVVYGGGTASHYVDGTEIGTYPHLFNTGNGPIVLGADLDESPYVDMEVAAVLVYNRALSAVEQGDIANYLAEKYRPAGAGAPVTLADAAVVGVAGAVDIDVLANDTPVEGAIDPSTVVIVSNALFGSVQINPLNGSIEYVHNGGAETGDEFSYQVANSDGRVSLPAIVSIEIDSDLSPVANDDAAVIIASAVLQIPVLANDEDDIGLDASSVVIVTQAVGGQLTVDPVTGEISYTHNGVVLSDSFQYTVADTTGQVSNVAEVSLGMGEGFPSDGLVLHLESDSGVQLSGDIVTSWSDQSGQNNNLTSTGDPRLIQSELYLPVIRLDGAGDRLERLSNITGLPTGNNDRTVFLLTRYDSNGTGGFSYGTADTNQTFGLTVNNFGRLTVQGWGVGNDFISGQAGTGAGWMLQSVVLNADNVTHAINGVAIDTQTHTFDTNIDRLMLGANLPGGPQVDMQVGAVLIYDRALAPIEQARILAAIDLKYGLNNWTDPLPVAMNDLVSVPSGSFVQINALANDSDLMEDGTPGSLDVTSVEIVQQPVNGSALVDQATGQISYSHNGSARGDEFTYTVSDAIGQVSNVATVSISNLPVAGLVAHYEADNLVSIDGAGALISVGDQSGQGNGLTPVGGVSIIADELNGRPVFDFDGVDGALRRTANLSGLPLGASARTMYQVVRYDSVGSGGSGYGLRSGNRAFGLHVQAPDGLLRINGYGPNNDKVSNTIGAGAGWMVQSVVYDGATATHSVNGQAIGDYNHTFATGNGPIVLGADLDENPYVDMQVAAFFLYDRALSASEQADLLAHLDEKYNADGEGAPLATADQAEAAIAGSVVVDVLANDIAVANGIDPTSVELVASALSGTVSINPSNGQITYMHNGDASLFDEFSYRVANSAGRYSAATVVTIAIDTDTSPIAVDDSATILAGVPTIVPVLSNDTDDFGLDASTISIITQPTGGTLTIDAAGVISYAHGGVVLSDSFEYTVADTTAQVSNVATVSLAVPDGIPAAGIVLRLESDLGVQLSGNTVSGWDDQSGNSNDLFSTGDPELVSSELYLPVISMDGDGDRLERLSNITALPMGATDRTVLLLARYDSVGFGGFAYGNADTNQVFGTVVNGFGRLAIQGWGAGNDFVTNRTGTGEGWLLQEAVLNADQLSHFVNGVQIANETHTFNTSNSRIMLGANIPGGPQVAMQIGAVIVYDRALTSLERTQISVYLDDKYGYQNWADPAPVAVDDSITQPSGTIRTVNVLANDSDLDENGAAGVLNLASVTIVTAPQNGTATVDTQTGLISYQHNGFVSGDEFTYVVADALGQQSNVATVTVSNLPTSGLVAHYESDRQVAVDATGNVTSITDLTGNGNDLTAVGDVTLVADALNGQPVLDFDGVGDALVRDQDVTGMPLGGSARTIYQVVEYNSVGSGGFAYGLRSSNRAFGLHVQAPDGLLRINGYGPANDKVSSTTGTGMGWIVQSAVYDGSNLSHAVNGQTIGSYTHTFNTGNGSIVLGADLDQNPYVDMRVAAVLVYDRALSNLEQNDLFDYLDKKYDADSVGAPLAQADSFNVDKGVESILSVLDNDIPVTGSIDPSSAEIVIQPSFGLASVNADGTLSYTQDGSNEITDSFTYRVANDAGRYSAAALVSLSVDIDLAPIALDDTAVILPGQDAVISVLGNDTDDNDLDPSSIVIVTQPAFGTLSINPVSGDVTYSHGGGPLVDSFQYTVDDLAGQTSNLATVELSIPDGLPAGGLVMHLESDSGVQLVGGAIASWADQSGQGNDLTSTGDPQLVTTSLVHPVVHLDGVGDRLERLSNLSGLPTGDSDRTVFLLVNYLSNGFGGFAYGTADNNQAFGLAVNNAGRVAVQGWGAGNDFVSTQAGAGQGWLVQSVVLSNDELSHYLNGNLIDTDTHQFNTVLSRIQLGANLPGGPQRNVQVGAILVYDRALNLVERAQIQSYISNKYGLTTLDDPAPVAMNDAVTVPGGQTSTIVVIDNDSDVDANGAAGALDISSVTIVQQPLNGTATPDPATGEVIYTHNGLTSGDEFTYTVADSNGRASNEATVFIQNFPITGLVARYEADRLVTLNGAGDVVSVGDASGSGNTLTATGDVRIEAAGLNGRPVFDFDGNGDSLIRTEVLAGFPMGSSARTVYKVVRYDDVGSGGFGYGRRSLNKTFGLHVQSPTGQLRINGFGGLNDFVSDTVGTGAGWIVQSAVYDGSQLDHYVNDQLVGQYTHTFDTEPGNLVLGADLDQDPYVDMQVALVLVYDRALSAAEQAEVTNYIDENYSVATAGGPVVINDSVNVFPGESVAIDALSNDTGPFIDPASFEFVSNPTNGTAVFNPATGLVDYQHSGAANDSFAYRVTDNLGRLSNTATVTVLIDNPAPQAMDDAVIVDAGSVTLINVLQNDTDDMSIDLTSVQIDTQPINGTATVQADGSIEYAHGNGVDISDTFTYVVADDEGLFSEPALVYVSIAGNDPAPAANDDVYTMGKGTSMALTVLSNDTDNTQLSLASIQIVADPSNGVATVNTATGEIDYTHGTGAFGDSFTYTVEDELGQVSNAATVSILSLPTSGLVAHFEADEGVVLNGAGEVQSVVDISGTGNDLVSVGDVTVLPGLNDNLVFDFDGNGDALVRNANFVDLPLGSTDRTMIQLVRYDSLGSGGVGYGQRSLNRTFGLHIQDPLGLLRINGFGGQADYVSNTVGTDAGWMIQSAVYENTNLDHAVNGSVIDSFNHTFATANGPLVLGADLDQTPYLDMQIGLVLIYDRALSADEMTEVEQYISNQYGFNPNQNTALPTDAAPIAIADAADVTVSESVIIDVAVNDTDDAQLDLATVAIVLDPSFGTTAIDAITGEITYTHSGGAETQDSFAYTISDSAGQASNAAFVTVAISPPTDTAPQAGDDSATVNAIESVDIDVLLNDSDDNALDVTTVLVTIAPANGSVVVDPGTGVITYTHSGGVELADSFEYTVADDLSQVSEPAIVSITIVPANQPPTVVDDQADLESGQTIDVAVLANDSDTTGIDAATVSIVNAATMGQTSIDPVTGVIEYIHDGVLSTGVDSFSYVVDDVGGLTSIEAVVTITITGQANIAPSVISDVLTLANEAEATVAVLTNDSDASGIDPTTVTLVTEPVHGFATVDPLTGVVSYSHDGTETTSDSLAYTVADTQGLVSDSAIVTITIEPIPDLAPTAVDDALMVAFSGSAQLAVLDNDTDDGAIDTTSVTIVSQAVFGTVQVQAGTGVVTYTHGGGLQASDSFTYTVADDSGQPSNEATVSIIINAPALLTSGLVLHLEADTDVTVAAGDVSTWGDQSGSGNDLSVATGLTGPTLLLGELNGHPVLEFDGTSDQLENTAALVDLPIGASERTVFLVHSTLGGMSVQMGDNVANGAISLGADEVSGNAYFDSVGAGNRHVSSVGLSGQGWTVQSLLVDAGGWEHYLGGASIDSGADILASGNTNFVIGGDIAGTEFSDMSLAAILVFDSALSEVDRLSVVAYLQVKYGISF